MVTSARFSAAQAQAAPRGLSGAVGNPGAGDVHIFVTRDDTYVVAAMNGETGAVTTGRGGTPADLSRYTLTRCSVAKLPPRGIETDHFLDPTAQVFTLTWGNDNTSVTVDYIGDPTCQTNERWRALIQQNLDSYRENFSPTPPGASE